MHDAIFGGDGHVHEGCFDVFKMLQRDITEVGGLVGGKGWGWWTDG